MDDPALRSRMGEYGRARVQTDLGWHVTSLNLLRAYDFLFGRVTKPEADQAKVA